MQIMTKLKERYEKWRSSRTLLQKAGDIFFWVLLLLLIIPGPRKVISTSLNRVILQVKNPGIKSEENQVALSDQDYKWILQTDDDLPFALNEYRGKVIFLNFWATWCPPCVAELPEIQRAYEKHGEDVAFLLVTNQDRQVVESFMEKYGYALPVHYSRTNPPGVFQSSSIPTTFIISREGRIVTRKTGAVNWDSRATDKIFQELLK